MRRGVALCLGLCACSELRPGVFVEVTDEPAGTDHVRLYVSTETCAGTCDSIAPPAAGSIATDAPLFGKGWIVDDSVPYQIASEKDGFLITSPQDVKLDRLIAIAFDASDTPIASVTFGPIKVHASESEIARVSLLPTDAIGSATDNEHVRVWGRPVTMGKTDCVVVQHGRTSASDTEFFVPSDDFDCDDVAASPECDPFAYLTKTSPPRDIAAANCVVNRTAVGCVLGGPPCSEAGPPPPNACAPLDDPAETHCLPQAACTQLCNGYSDVCLGAPYFANTAVPAIGCHFFYDANSVPCTNATLMGTIDASEIVWDTGFKCKSLELGLLKAPPVFGNVLMLENTTYTLGPSFQQDRCTNTIAWSGTPPSAGRALARIQTDTGVMRVVPITFSKVVVQTCIGNEGFKCLATRGDANDSLWKCK